MSMFKDWPTDSLRGAHAILRLLYTSPRFNKPQREVIHDLYEQVADALRAKLPEDPK